MLIEGLFTIKLVENTEDLGREIHINFLAEYCSFEIDKQSQVLSDYIKELQANLLGLEQDSQEYQGMTTIVKFAESIYPHIVAGEIPLEETIVIEIEQGNILSALINQRSAH